MKYNDSVSLEEGEGSIASLKKSKYPIPSKPQNKYDELKKREQAKQIDGNRNTYIYDTLVANYPYGEMPQEKKDCIENTVEKLLDDSNNAQEPGLLLGKVQCGKTDTFEAIIGLAFDRGIDVAIVLTKGTNPLAEQTLKRMRFDYRFFADNDRIDQPVIINIHDIMTLGNGLREVNVNKSKTVIICKKEARNLERLMNLFNITSSFLKERKVLIVDDEADFASRTYRTVRQDDDNKTIEMATISQQIDDFRGIPKYCRYLQVTATPYSLYLQPDGDLNFDGKFIRSFKPRFTSLVPIHEAYIGGNQYFEESKDSNSMYSHLFHPVSQRCMRVLEHRDKRYLNNSIQSDNIFDLTYALMSYFMATSIRRIQVRVHNRRVYKTSALIHVNINRRWHDWQKDLINAIIGSLRDVICTDTQRKNQRIWESVDRLYSDFLDSNNKGRNQHLLDIDIPSKEDVVEEMRKIFSDEDYYIQVVNSDNEVRNLLDATTGELKLETAANIFIGGNILDRGITVKNMLCFFYGRDPRDFRQNTVLQHSRMYGARSKEDMAVTRFHTTLSLYQVLSRINELDNDLRNRLIQGDNQENSDVVFIGYDGNIQPCAYDSIKVSNALTLRQHMRFLPKGFWTGSNNKINKTISQIDMLIEKSSNYDTKDDKGFFEMPKDEVISILKLIESTYVYDEKYNNVDYINNMKELRCALDYCLNQSNGKIYALHRTNRDVKRIRENGAFIDAPDDGNNDTNPAKEKAIDAPVIMFIKEEGNRRENEWGVNVGWNNAPFYWPVLLTQKNINPVMFAFDTRNSIQLGFNRLLSGIDYDDLIKISKTGNLVKNFGDVGTEHDLSEEGIKCPIRETTAANYICRSENGEWQLNESVKIDSDHWHGLYSQNKGLFPFVLRDYKYMALYNPNKIMLVELYPMKNWGLYQHRKINKDGFLCDFDTDQELIPGTDVITSENLDKSYFNDLTIVQWVIEYKIKTILMVTNNPADLKKFFDN